MKLFQIVQIFFFFGLYWPNNAVAQQTTGTKEEKTTQQGTVFRTANPNYSEQVISGGKISSERMKNPTMESDSTPQRSNPNLVITNERRKNPVNTEGEKK